MEAEERAQTLLDDALRDEQVAWRFTTTDDVGAVRAEVRRLARARGVRIRTGVLDDVLAVVRLDAAVWTESADQMRRKLTPADDG